MDCSLPGSSVHRILQARILEWVSTAFSGGSSWPRNQTWVSHALGRFFTIWTTREAQWMHDLIWIPKLSQDLFTVVTLIPQTWKWSLREGQDFCQGLRFESEQPDSGSAWVSLACCSPWGLKESDMTEQLNWPELKREWMGWGKNRSGKQPHQCSHSTRETEAILEQGCITQERGAPPPKKPVTNTLCLSSRKPYRQELLT